MNYTMGYILEILSMRARGASDDDIFEFIRSEDVDGQVCATIFRAPQALFAERWAKHGLPHVEMAHTLCASLLGTSMPSSDAAALVVPPWDDFAVSIPHGILPMPSGTGRSDWARIVLVSTASRQSGLEWEWQSATDDKSSVMNGGWARTQDFLSGTFKRGHIWGSDCKTQEDYDSGERKRFAKAVGRLIAGTCIRMSDPRHFVHASKPKNGNGRRDGRDSPIPTRFDTYRLIGDVKVDVRKAVAEYVRHGGKSPTVQSMVRGHWKHQTHGPGGTQRKLIHVEPYWRGPEDAPIAIRSHVVEASE